MTCKVCGSHDIKIIKEDTVFQYNNTNILLCDMEYVHCKNCGADIDTVESENRRVNVIKTL